MTTDEARRVLAIMVTADNSCEVCAGNQFDKFLDEFGDELEPLAREVWARHFETTSYVRVKD